MGIIQNVEVANLVVTESPSVINDFVSLWRRFISRNHHHVIMM
jgi:hypothetical protein